jgi:hypothetical protein
MVFEAAVSLCKPLGCTVAVRYATSTSRLAVCLYHSSVSAIIGNILWTDTDGNFLES